MRKIITYEIETDMDDDYVSKRIEDAMFPALVSGSLQITAAPRIDHYNGRPYEVYPFDDDTGPVSFTPVDFDDHSKGWLTCWWSGRGTPDEARKVAAALNVAAGLCERMKGDENN